jgi:RimJ/RimL family protein N-acetyltransferase
MNVEIRPIRADDAACLSDAWALSSLESRQCRMNAPLARIRPAELRYLTEVDHHDHEAMVAIDNDSGRLVGVMRYIRMATRSDEADLAALVVDDWQRHGVGTALFPELAAHALEDGIERFRAIVSPENSPAIAALRRRGAQQDTHDCELDFVLPVQRAVTARA